MVKEQQYQSAAASGNWATSKIMSANESRKGAIGMELTYTEQGLSDPEHQADPEQEVDHREVRTDAQGII